MLNALAWVELHRRHLITGFVVVIAVIGAVYLWRHLRDQKEQAANRALLELHARPGEPDSGPKAADFLKIADKHAGTSAAARARLLAAGALFAEGRYADAQAEFERVLAGGIAGALSGQAAFGVAASLDAQDKVDAAVAKYQEVIASYGEESVAGQARLALARIEETRSRPEAALRLYEEVARARGESLFAQLAEDRKETLLRNFPQLATAGGGAVAGTNVVVPANP